MNSFVFVALCTVFAAANAGVLGNAPLLSTYAAGPVLSTYAAAPVVSAYSAPLVSTGLVGEQTVVAGPSGTIATGKTLAAAPAYTAYGSPIVSSYAAPGLVARTIW